MENKEIVKRPSIRLSCKEHKHLKVFCAINEISIQEFMRNSVLYCMDKRIMPGTSNKSDDASNYK